jgi:hypothetical protein
MRLSDLNDDLAEWDGFGERQQESGCAIAVARRVAALYDECPTCGGGGKDAHSVYDGHTCVHCAGCGVVPSPALKDVLGHYGWTNGAQRHAVELARFLFDGDR